MKKLIVLLSMMSLFATGCMQKSAPPVIQLSKLSTPPVKQMQCRANNCELYSYADKLLISHNAHSSISTDVFDDDTLELQKTLDYGKSGYNGVKPNAGSSSDIGYAHYSRYYKGGKKKIYIAELDYYHILDNVQYPYFSSLLVLDDKTYLMAQRSKSRTKVALNKYSVGNPEPETIFSIKVKNFKTNALALFLGSSASNEIFTSTLKDPETGNILLGFTEIYHSCNSRGCENNSVTSILCILAPDGSMLSKLSDDNQDGVVVAYDKMFNAPNGITASAYINKYLSSDKYFIELNTFTSQKLKHSKNFLGSTKGYFVYQSGQDVLFYKEMLK